MASGLAQAYGGRVLWETLDEVRDNITDLDAGLNKRTISSLTTATPAALTAAQSGTIFTFNRAAGIAIALPAVGASDVGVWYRFVFETTATGDHTITAQAADLLTGGLWMVDFDAGVAAPQAVWFAADVSNDLIITMNGTTKGGKLGSWLDLTCVGATRWMVTGLLAGDGTIVTPFS
jgi:hypothetical protein